MSKTLKQHYRFLLFSFLFSFSFEYNFTFLYNFSKIYLSFYHLNVEQNHKVCTRWRSETSIFIKIQAYILQHLTCRTSFAVKMTFSRSITEVDEAANWTFLATVTHKS